MENTVRKCRPEELKKLTPVFGDWEETMIWSCLQGIMGDVYVEAAEKPLSAGAMLNDFYFLGGEPSEALAGFDGGKQFLIMVPQNEAWAKVIEKVWGDKALRCTRYAIKKEPDCFDRERLEQAIRNLPENYQVREIDRELYEQCRSESWSQDLVAGYPNYEEFERLGVGFVVTENGRVLSGASAYSRYRDGIEIEIDTKMEHRRKGLALAAGAALILKCLDLGLYPSWDAQNKGSVALSEKLGYSFSHEYPVYEIRKDSGLS